MSPLWSVKIAEKERMGLPYPYAVLVDTSAMPVASWRAIWLANEWIYSPILRELEQSVEDWDRATLAGINTWVNLESYPVSRSWMIPVRVSAGIACHRLQTHACVPGIASARALC